MYIIDWLITTQPGRISDQGLGHSQQYFSVQTLVQDILSFPYRRLNLQVKVCSFGDSFPLLFPQAGGRSVRGFSGSGG